MSGGGAGMGGRERILSRLCPECRALEGPEIMT